MTVYNFSYPLQAAALTGKNLRGFHWGYKSITHCTCPQNSIHTDCPKSDRWLTDDHIYRPTEDFFTTSLTHTSVSRLARDYLPADQQLPLWVGSHVYTLLCEEPPRLIQLTHNVISSVTATTPSICSFLTFSEPSTSPPSKNSEGEIS